MSPVELNTYITAITNYLFCKLSEKEFFNLGVFLSLISKEMLSMEAIRDLCKIEKRLEKEHEKDKPDKQK